MDKVLKNITRIRHPKLLTLTYGHGQSLENITRVGHPKLLPLTYGHGQSLEKYK